MCDGKGEFSVKVAKEEVVAARLPMQEYWLPLSNLDLLLPPIDVCVFFCYKKPSTSFESSIMVSCLKNSLAQALVSYYALAGEVVHNSMGEPEILCNNRGVDFVEAVADVELQSLDLYNADHTVEGKLVPKKNHGILAIQATRLKCGALVVACTFDHRIADAYSTNMFLVSWAEMARLKNNTTKSPQPCFRRSLLTPRRPLSIHHSLNDMYIPMSDLPPSPPPQFKPDPISRIYYVTTEQLNNMRSLANVNNATNNHTKLVSFSAFLWKMVAAKIEGKQNTAVAKMGVVVDGRKRFSSGGDKKAPMIMTCYFGNVLSVPHGKRLAKELVQKPLSWVVEKVHEFLDMAVTEEHFLGLIDWVETQRPIPGMPRIFCSTTQEEEGPSFVVTSGLRFPESEVDFGWGKPVFGSYYFPSGTNAWYVMPMPSPKRNGDWLVCMYLPKTYLHFIESTAPHFFRPVNWGYLN